MSARSVNLDNEVVRMIRDNPAYAEIYLQTAMEEIYEEGGIAAFLTALRQVVEALGGIGELAEKTSLKREHLYRAISQKGNPTLSTLTTAMRTMNIRFKPLLVHEDECQVS